MVYHNKNVLEWLMDMYTNVEWYIYNHKNTDEYKRATRLQRAIFYVITNGWNDSNYPEKYYN